MMYNYVLCICSYLCDKDYDFYEIDKYYMYYNAFHLHTYIPYKLYLLKRLIIASYFVFQKFHVFQVFQVLRVFQKFHVIQLLQVF